MVFLMAAVRLGITVWQLETAPGVLRVLAQDSTLGWIGMGHEPVGEWPAAREADFWLSEADRILAQHPIGDIAIGAALVLDDPASRARGVDVTIGPRCAEIAKRATELAPNDPTAWRVRALLVMEPNGKPRDPHWREIVEEAASHDAQDAFCDYLLAQQSWSASSQWEFDGNKLELRIHDLTAFAMGATYFKRGLQKPTAHLSVTATQAVFEFLKHSSVPMHEYPEFFYRVNRSERDFTELFVRKYLLLENRQRVGNRFALIGQWLQMAKQLERAGDSSAFTALGSAREEVAALVAIPLYFPGGLSPGDEKALQSLRVDLATHNAICGAALNRIGRAWWTATDPVGESLKLVCKDISASIPPLIMMAVAAWLFAALLARSNGDAYRPMGALRLGTCWLLALTSSFVLLGLCPAHVISPEIQDGAARTLPAVALAAAAFSLVMFRRSRAMQWGMLMVLPVVGAMLAIWSERVLWRLTPESRYIIPRHGASSVPPSDSFHEVFLQWHLYSGITVGLAMALVWIALWSLIRAVRETAPAAPSRWKLAIGRCARETSRSAVWFAVFAVLVLLVILPTYLHIWQSDYETFLNAYTLTAPGGETFGMALNAIMSDPKQMKEFRSWAEQQIASETQQAN